MCTVLPASAWMRGPARGQDDDDDYNVLKTIIAWNDCTHTHHTSDWVSFACLLVLEEVDTVT
jgi:hypothetical protein